MRWYCFGSRGSVTCWALSKSGYALSGNVNTLPLAKVHRAENLQDLLYAQVIEIFRSCRRSYLNGNFFPALISLNFLQFHDKVYASWACHLPLVFSALASKP